MSAAAQRIPSPLARSPHPGDAAAQRPQRLEALRNDLLAAPYALCTQKAELLTEYFQDHVPGDALVDAVAPLHFAAVRRGLERSLGSGAPQPLWQLRVSSALQGLYARRFASTSTSSSSEILPRNGSARPSIRTSAGSSCCPSSNGSRRAR